ncbi:MAG: rhodanese-like domain-containing protein [Gemmatimonadaceae bacterium]|nr:rhodanese-like domain-containing protein [Gemmatimonadaceae bacterium]
MSYQTGEDLLEDARTRITEIAPAHVAGIRERAGKVTCLDVREPNEWNLGRIPGAVFLPRGLLESKIEELLPRDSQVIVYCARGNRSALAADTLRQMGYDNVASMSGGFAQWVMEGREVES